MTTEDPTPRSGPNLHTITVTDDPGDWERAGFTPIDDGSHTWVDLGGVAVSFDAAASSPISWGFTGLSDPTTDNVDGIAVTPGRPGLAPTDTEHEPSNSNGVFHLDHAVMMSPSLPRTVPALEAAGFEVRRRRDIPQGRQQVFLWAGATIIELVGPVDAADDLGVDEHPSQLWGLAMSTRHLDQAAANLGDGLGTIKDAVQAGRNIATIRTRELGITPTIALMTPHNPS